jgi:hypothetical protein
MAATTPPSRRRYGIGLLALSALVLAGCAAAASRPDPRTTTSSSTSTTTTTTTTVPVADCPLTGAPVPNGGPVPPRPALAVKVDNYPAARPQSGLDAADIVFEEPVEGGITRYVAVYQCQEAPVVGPVRSARNIDIGILGEFGQPLLAHVGGIDPVIADIAASPIVNLDLGLNGQVIQHPAGRVAPYDTYTTTAALWGLRPTDTTPPGPIFTYSATPPPGSPVASVSIPFSNTSPVVWKYDPTQHLFQRYYVFTPDLSADHAPNRAANVVVQFVDVSYGPWLENEEGGLEVQANLYDDASGPAEIFRDGEEITGTWHRSTLSQATQFVDAAGQTIALRPGPTWVELVPSTVPVKVQPPG